MSSPQSSRPASGFGRNVSMPSSPISDFKGGLVRSSTMSTTISGSSYKATESSRGQFQDQLNAMAVGLEIPLTLPRSMLSLPNQRAVPVYPSDKAGAEEFLMSQRPKRFLLGKNSKGFASDEVLLGLDKALGGRASPLIIEGLLQLAETAGAGAAASGGTFTANKKGQAIPTLAYLFTKAEHSQSPAIWRLFLSRVSQRSLDASLASVLTDRGSDAERVRSLLEYGANPELCQDRILDLIASGSEELVETLLLSPLLNNVEFLSHGLLVAASSYSLRNTCMLLLRGADANFSQAGALKKAVSAQSLGVALAIVMMAKAPVSSNYLDDAVGLIGPWSQENQDPFLKILLYAGASGPRTSKAVIPFITGQVHEIVSILIDCPAFRHGTFPAPRLFQFAIETRNSNLASEVLRSSNNRSSADYVSTGTHLQLVKDYSTRAEETHSIISDLLTLGVGGDYTSQMLAECCKPEQIKSPHIMALIDLLIRTGAAKATYSDGAALRWAIQAANPAVVGELVATKPTKKVLTSAVQYTSSCLGDENPAKLEIWSMLLDAGASGPAVDQELVVAIDNNPHAHEKVKLLLKGASLDYLEGKAIAKAVQLKRLDLLETLLAQKAPQYLTFTSVWKQTRKMFALAGSNDGMLPYTLTYMQRVIETLYDSSKGSAPLNELLLDATQCTSKEAALVLSKLFLRWGASPDHALGAPLQACIRRADTKTLAALLAAKTSKTSLKYGLVEALSLRGNGRQAILEILVGAGLEKASLDAALPQVLKEDRYDGPTVHLLVEAGATLHSSFGENLVPPSVHLDQQVVEKLLPAVGRNDNLLVPLKAVLGCHSDWQSPDGKSLSMVKLLVKNCSKGTWSDRYFIAGVKSGNRHSAQIFADNLSSDVIYSVALHELLVSNGTALDRKTLSMTQYLLQNGARGKVIDEFFTHAAQALQHEWVSTLYPYLSDRTVALSAFDLVVNGKGPETALAGNRLEVVQFLLKQGLKGPVVDDAFVKAASTADLKAMNDFSPFVSSKATFSESLSLLSQRQDLLTSREGLAAIQILLGKGASDVSVTGAARAAAKALSLAGVKLIIEKSRNNPTTHAAFQGLMEHVQPLSSSSLRTILFYLLENGLAKQDLEHVARLAAAAYDVAVVKALASLESASHLYDIMFDAIALARNRWLTPEGLQFVEYLLGRGVSGPAIYKLVEVASKALHLSALRILLPACQEGAHKGKGVEIAFNSVVSDEKRWTSSEGLQVVRFLLESGAKGIAVEKAAAYAAKTSNYDALDVFLKGPAAATAIPAAFKALTRHKPGQLSSDQLTIASTLVKEGVSTEVLAIAAVEMAKLLDIEGLKVLSGSPNFRQVSDDVLRAMLLSEDLWRAAAGVRITHFLLEKGISTKMVEAVALRAARALDIDVLRNVLESNSSATVIESAFTSMTGLEKKWLCPEGLRIADYLLQREPSQESINKAFIQSSQYLHSDAIQLLHPHVKDVSVFNEALYRAVSTESEWLSELHLIQLLLESGVEGDALEFAFLKGAQALDIASLELLAPRIDRPEVHTKAIAAATEGTTRWLHCLNVIEFLLHHGANGEPIDKAYISASKALDLQAATLLSPHVDNKDTHNHAFRAAISNESWLLPSSFELLQFLHNDGVVSDAIGVALVSAAEAINPQVVELLSQNADEKWSSQAFMAATRDVEKWTSPEGSKIIQILAQKGARGDSVDEALINSARLFRLDLVTVLAPNIDKENFGCVSLAFDAVLSGSGGDSSSTIDAWMFNPDALNILQMLVSMEAHGESANDALVSAAALGSNDAVAILLQVVNDPSIYTDAFNAMTASGELWLDNYYFSLVEALLSRGTADEGVHSALVTAIGYVIQGVASPELLELLLSHDADVNFDHGKALQLAAESAREDLLEMLLRKNPSSHSTYMSLQTALRVGHEEEIVLQFFKSAAENEFVQEKPDVNNYSDLGYPLLFYCLNNYPASARLAKKICELNADLSATLDWDIFENEYDEPLSDGLTPLLIALEKDCSDDVIGVLLDHGAEINFSTEQYQVSPLMTAAGKGRTSVVSTLIDRGASVIQKDSRDRTPLCHAARNGDLSTIRSILKKNPARNDGSVHESARELHADAVKLLVKAGHDIHFPSSKHGGRSPLCELCLVCRRASQDPVGLQRTLTELATAKADPLRKSRGRTALFMAMENENPIPVVTALIEACLWKDLNDPQNIYEEGDYFYSPTMYIKKGRIQQPEATQMQLLEKLQDFSATDRYYAKERMHQPRDAVGMPQRLQDLDHKKWIRTTRIEEEEEDFERKLKRADQEVANRQILSQRQHLMLMEQRENIGQQQSMHTLDTHLLGMKLKDREHGIGLMHQEELYDRRLGEMASGNVMKLNIETAQHQAKFGMQQQSRQAQLQHEGLTQDQKLSYLGQEQGMRYSSLEAQQDLRLEGMSSEAELKRQQQQDELRYRESRSGVDRGDLDHRLQHANQMNTSKIQANRELSDMEYNARRNKNLLEDESRQSQLQHQYATDERKISTQGALNQHEYARNQDQINTLRNKGQIEIGTRAAVGQIETDTLHNKLQMTQQDRSHKIATEQQLGQVQNQNLAEKFQITQEDRHNQLETESRMGQIKVQNLQGQLGTKLHYQKASNQERLGFQQQFDHQTLQTLQTKGNIENSTLQTKGNIENSTLQTKGKIENSTAYQRANINLEYQQRSGNMKLGQQRASKAIDLQAQQASGNMRIGQMKATEQIKAAGNRFRHQDNLNFKQLGG